MPATAACPSNGYHHYRRPTRRPEHHRRIGRQTVWLRCPARSAYRRAGQRNLDQLRGRSTGSKLQTARVRLARSPPHVSGRPSYTSDFSISMQSANGVVWSDGRGRVYAVCAGSLCSSLVARSRLRTCPVTRRMTFYAIQPEPAGLGLQWSLRQTCLRRSPTAMAASIRPRKAEPQIAVAGGKAQTDDDVRHIGPPCGTNGLARGGGRLPERVLPDCRLEHRGELDPAAFAAPGARAERAGTQARGGERLGHGSRRSAPSLCQPFTLWSWVGMQRGGPHGRGTGQRP